LRNKRVSAVLRRFCVCRAALSSRASRIMRAACALTLPRRATFLLPHRRWKWLTSRRDRARRASSSSPHHSGICGGTRAHVAAGHRLAYRSKDQYRAFSASAYQRKCFRIFARRVASGRLGFLRRGALCICTVAIITRFLYAAAAHILPRRGRMDLAT
jgi:hypothetical protein